VADWAKLKAASLIADCFISRALRAPAHGCKFFVTPECAVEDNDIGTGEPHRAVRELLFQRSAQPNAMFLTDCPKLKGDAVWIHPREKRSRPSAVENPR